MQHRKLAWEMGVPLAMISDVQIRRDGVRVSVILEEDLYIMVIVEK